MPEKYLDGIDLAKTQLTNAKLQLIAGDYTNPEEGLVWYDQTAKQLAFYDGTQVRRVPLTGGGGDAATVGGATAAQLRDRSTHTGSQPASTISDFASQVASLTAGYIDASELETRIGTLIGSAPGLLDTLDELAAAIGDDANFAANIQTQINARTRKFSAAIASGTASPVTVTHSLGTRDVSVSMYENVSPFSRVSATVEMTTINAVTVRYAAPPANALRVVVIG